MSQARCFVSSHCDSDSNSASAHRSKNVLKQQVQLKILHMVGDVADDDVANKDQGED